jgi:hypothetical protein
MELLCGAVWLLLMVGWFGLWLWVGLVSEGKR